MRIDSEKDELIARWVQSEFEPQQVEAAVLALGGRAWPAKVAARLGKRVPDEVWDPQAVAASATVKLLNREKLRALRSEFAAGVQRSGQRSGKPPFP